tara:strand:+ start:535 stop:708 length:174 start_codon:yes stop_codon:yes gene_type:complete
VSNNQKGAGKQKKLPGHSSREDRLAEALRTNLARRKEQNRLRQDTVDVVKTPKTKNI